MVAQIVSFFQRAPRLPAVQLDWAQQEIAEFYRVESALIRAGIRVGTDRGISDEGEPWFVFFRDDDGEVVIHFARIDGEYIIAGPAYEEIARGLDFTALVRNMIARHPLVRKSERGDNVFLHPAALLIAVVGTAFFKTGEARASETGREAPAKEATSRVALLGSAASPVQLAAAAPAAESVQIPAHQAVLILAAALLSSDYKVAAPVQDASARAALAATAAVLDFSGTTPSPVLTQDDAAVAASAARAAAVETAAAQHMSSVLSLMALLSDIPQTRSAANDGAPSEAALWAGSPAPIESLLVPQPLSANNGDWAIDVRLSFGAMPAVEALQLVRGQMGDAAFEKVSVIEVTKLPGLLADLISKGQHVYVTSPTPVVPEQVVKPLPPVEPVLPVVPHDTVPVVVAPTVPEPEAPPPVATPSPEVTLPVAVAPSVVVPSVIVPAPVAVVPAVPVTPPAAVVPVAPTPAVQSPTPAYASPALVKQFIDYFIAHTDKIEIMYKGSSFVIFDTRVLYDVSKISHLSSMTFDFADGSSISLVGDHLSFLHKDVLT